MGACDGAEACEIVGLFLLNNLGNKFEKDSVDLYRGNGLATSKNINGYHADKISKKLHQLFKKSGLSLETECKINTVNYLDISLDLTLAVTNHIAKPMMKQSIFTQNPNTQQMLQTAPINTYKHL